jgi:predicted nuclease of predicted toxin-antitoxin system
MIIADENIDARIISFLRASKIDVYAVIENNSGITDEEAILLAKEKNLIILTEDKDFGEWIFAHGVKDCSIIFLRYDFKEYERISYIIFDLITDNNEKLYNRFVTVTVNKIRIRKI